MSRILFGVTASVTAQSFLRPQLTELIATGWDVHLVSSPDSTLTSMQQVNGLKLHAIPMKRHPSLVSDLVSLYRWHRLIKDVQPDIVVGSTPKAALLSMLASKWNATQVRIYHVRGFRAEGLSGLSRNISLLAEKVTNSSATVVLCDSPSLQKALRNSGSLGQHEGLVLGSGSCCGVDTEFFRPPTPEERVAARLIIGADDATLAIGFVGRITKDKGVHELLQAVLTIKEKYENTHLFLVGPDEDGIAHLGDLLQSKCVTHLGQMSDVRSIYWALDVFTLPSYREGFPISAIEAQSCGLPLITTTATGCVDSQCPSNLNLTIPPKDTESLALAIEYLITNRGKSSMMGLEAREWVRENFESSVVVQNHTEFLKSQIAPPLNHHR